MTQIAKITNIESIEKGEKEDYSFISQILTEKLDILIVINNGISKVLKNRNQSIGYFRVRCKI